MIFRFYQKIPVSWRIITASLAWLILISAAHYALNVEKGGRKIIRMGHMPVISNLSAPLLDYASRDNKKIYFQADKFSSFAELGEALRNNQVQVAFMIAPLSIVLRQQGADVKLVCIGNRHESTLVVRKSLHAKSLKDLAGKTLAVPMRFSGHHLSVRRLMEEQGMEGQINIVEMNPPDMAAGMAAGALDAYYVGEPFAAKTVMSGHSEVLYYSEDVWKYFICNLMVVRNDFIKNDPETVRLLIESAVRSGFWAQKHIREAAEIAAKHWNQPPELVEYAMNTPPNRVVYDHYTPRNDEMQYMADLMVKYGLIKSNDISGLVEDKFAKSANLNGITNLKSIMPSDKSPG